MAERHEDRTRQVMVRVTPELKQKLTEIADFDERTVSSVIRRALRAYVADRSNVEKVQVTKK